MGTQRAAQGAGGGLQSRLPAAEGAAAVSASNSCQTPHAAAVRRAAARAGGGAAARGRSCRRSTACAASSQPSTSLLPALRVRWTTALCEPSCCSTRSASWSCTAWCRRSCSETRKYYALYNSLRDELRVRADGAVAAGQHHQPVPSSQQQRRQGKEQFVQHMDGPCCRDCTGSERPRSRRWSERSSSWPPAGQQPSACRRSSAPTSRRSEVSTWQRHRPASRRSLTAATQPLLLSPPACRLPGGVLSQREAAGAAASSDADRRCRSRRSRLRSRQRSRQWIQWLSCMLPVSALAASRLALHTPIGTQPRATRDNRGRQHSRDRRGDSRGLSTAAEASGSKCTAQQCSSRHTALRLTTRSTETPCSPPSHLVPADGQPRLPLSACRCRRLRPLPPLPLRSPPARPRTPRPLRWRPGTAGTR